MAQPKNRRQKGPEDKETSARRLEIENLSKKAEGIVQKRNELNTQAQAARGERDLLNTKRRELFDEMKKVKAERDGFNAKLREAKALRGEYQDQAKELIAKRRAKFKKDQPQTRSPRLRAQELLAEINDLEFSQQTRVLSTAQENELLKQLRMKKAEYDKIKKEASKAAQLKLDLSDTDKAIDQLFAKAEEQHQIVVAISKSSQEAHERFVKLVNEVATATAEANKHHQHMLDVRGKADEQHQAFLELRDKMLDLRGQDFADRREAREVIKEQRLRVRDAVANPERLAEHADEALEMLKKGGKIRLG